MSFVKRFASWNISGPNALIVDVGLLASRVLVGGLMMLAHGYGKVVNVFQGNFQFADPIGIGEAPSLILAAGAEFFCSLLVMAGLATRFALIPLIITMSVAFFIAHAEDPFRVKELALIFLFSFIVLLVTGPGRFSVDAVLKK